MDDPEIYHACSKKGEADIEFSAMPDGSFQIAFNAGGAIVQFCGVCGCLKLRIQRGSLTLVRDSLAYLAGCMTAIQNESSDDVVQQMQEGLRAISRATFFSYASGDA